MIWILSLLLFCSNIAIASQLTIWQIKDADSALYAAAENYQHVELIKCFYEVDEILKIARLKLEADKKSQEAFAVPEVVSMTPVPLCLQNIEQAPGGLLARRKKNIEPLDKDQVLDESVLRHADVTRLAIVDNNGRSILIGSELTGQYHFAPGLQVTDFDHVSPYLKLLWQSIILFVGTREKSEFVARVFNQDGLCIQNRIITLYQYSDFSFTAMSNSHRDKDCKMFASLRKNK
jgi:hypothetical protein